MNKQELIKSRKRLNLSQEQLSKILKCSSSRVSQLESDNYESVLDSYEIKRLKEVDPEFDLSSYLEIDVLTTEDKQRIIIAENRIVNLEKSIVNLTLELTKVKYD